MAWQALKIAANAHTAEILGDALMELGALSVSIEDAHAGTPEEQEIFGELGEIRLLACGRMRWSTPCSRPMPI